MTKIITLIFNYTVIDGNQTKTQKLLLSYYPTLTWAMLLQNSKIIGFSGNNLSTSHQLMAFCLLLFIVASQHEQNNHTKQI